MPRPKREAGAEPKKRSRTGCWPCKARKVKCGEEKPACANCVKSGEKCDYSIRLNWAGRSRKDKDGVPTDGGFTFIASPTPGSRPGSSQGGPAHEHHHVFSAQHIAAAPQRPGSRGPADLPTPDQTPGSDAGLKVDTLIKSDPETRSAPATYPPLFPPNIGTAHQSPTFAERPAPTSVPFGDDFNWSPQHRAKRMRLSSPSLVASPNLPVFSLPQYSAQLDSGPMFTPHSISSIVNSPNTPASSIQSNSPFPQPAACLTVQDPPDLRRLSVKSLLSDPTDEDEKPPPPRQKPGHHTYGYDHGIPDLDVPRNDDDNVVLPKSPDMRRPSAAFSEISNSDEADAKQMAFEPGGYYAQPVPIRIPRALEPLPQELLDNQMNLLYFHHFINHTGRIMVPHDCPENPFRSVLPQLAVRNQQLLHLLLAFSASHRAKLLDHPEPANRIAEWMSDVIPALRSALDAQQRNDNRAPSTSDPSDPATLAPLATAIMLASFEIVTPTTFSVRIPWQKHLEVARAMILATGGLHHLATRVDGGGRDKAIFFLSRWFAYLDVLGSLSNRHVAPLGGAYLEDGGGQWLVNRGDEEIYQIDCFFGFSGRCIALLAQVAELAALCDGQRIDPVTNRVHPAWRPPAEIRRQAEELQQRLFASATTVFRGCVHSNSKNAASLGVDSPSSLRSGSTADDRDTTTLTTTHQDHAEAEIYATNEAYHWAGLLHLSRRVLALPSSHPQVQSLVARIISSLSKVRRGSTAEGCLLFPMFSAGCEAQTEAERELFMERLTAVEGWGMQHVGRAKALMVDVWRTGRGWEELVPMMGEGEGGDGMFFG